MDDILDAASGVQPLPPHSGPFAVENFWTVRSRLYRSQWFATRCSFCRMLIGFEIYKICTVFCRSKPPHNCKISTKLLFGACFLGRATSVFSKGSFQRMRAKKRAEEPKCAGYFGIFFRVQSYKHLKRRYPPKSWQPGRSKEAGCRLTL